MRMINGDLVLEEDEQRTVEEIEEAEAREKQLKIAYRITFSSREGFDVLKDLVGQGHLLETSYRADAREHALVEGERNLLLYILSKLSAEIKNKLMEV